MLPYLFEALKDAEDGDSNLLDRTAIIYGSPIADGEHPQPPEEPPSPGRKRPGGSSRGTCT